MTTTAITRPTTLVKRSGETRQYTEDFSLLPEMIAGDRVASVTTVTTAVQAPASGATDLTISSLAVSGDSKGATFNVAGGTNGVTYRVTTTVLTAGGSILVGVGYLKVDDE